MPYMGKVDVKASDIKRFDVTGSTSATHTLSWTAPSEQSLIITINGVKQQDSAYTISGSPTTITLASALVATDEMEVIGINDIGQTNTVAQDSIVTDMIRDDAVTSAKLANAINITSGNSLTIDSGATITNNGTASGFGGNNTPILASIRSVGQSISASTWTKIQLDSIQIDTDTAWDAVNYRWTVPSGEGGKYLISGAVRYYNGSGNLNARYVAIYKNGTLYRLSVAHDPGSGNCYRDCPTLVIILELSASDYIELYGYFTSGSATSIEDNGTYLNINKLVE